MKSLFKFFSKSPIKNNQGFTLIEIIASIFLIGLILTSFFTIFIQSSQYSNNNEDKLHVTNFTRDLSNRIETITIEDLIKKGVIKESQIIGDFSPITLPNSTTTTEELLTLLQINDSNYDVKLELRPGPKTKESSKTSLIEVTIHVSTKQSTGINTSSKTFTYIGRAKEAEK